MAWLFSDPTGRFHMRIHREPPMPVALPHATCGPQVPGTVRPKKYSDLASLNLCPANQCVSILRNSLTFRPGFTYNAVLESRPVRVDFGVLQSS